MNSSLKKKLAAGEQLIGTIVTLPSAEIAEILGRAGFDWLFVDLEHSALSFRDAQLLLQAAGPEIPCLVRIPSNDETWIKKALDIGAAGIIVPQVNTLKDARQAVRGCKYPPQGSRSVGIGRAHGYGARFQDYVSTANDDVVVVLQIEHIDAVDNIEEIVNVSGIDCLFVGPYDLSASMGKLGLTDDTGVLNAISKVKRNADKSAIPLGIFGATAQAVDPYIQNGYQLIVVGIDTMLMAGAAKNILGSLKSYPSKIP